MNAEHLLKGDYLEAYHRVSDYGSATGVDELYLKECLSDLSDVLLSAQERETPLEKIIGRDEEKFCRSFFSEYPIGDRASFLTRGIRGELVLVALSGIESMVEAVLEGESVFSATVRSGFTQFFLIVCVMTIIIKKLLLTGFMRKYYFRLKNQNAFNVRSGIVILLLTYGIAFHGVPGLDQLPVFPVVLVITIYLIAFYGLSAVNRHRTTGRFGNPNRRWRVENQIERKKAKQENFNLKFAWGMKCRFENENRKRVKCGKAGMNAEEFMHRFQRENRKMRFVLKIWRGLMLVFVAVQVVVIIVFTAEFLEWLPLFLGYDCGLPCGYFVLHSVCKSRFCVEQRCDERNINVLDYATTE